MKLLIILILMINSVASQIFQPVNTAEIAAAVSNFRSQIPLLQQQIPLARRLAGNSDPNNCYPFCNLPNLDAVGADLARLQTITPEDIRAYQESERNPSTTPVSIGPNVPATRRPTFKYPEIKNALNGPNTQLKNVGSPYGRGLGLQYIYG